MDARLVVLISGHGRNLQALIDACADGRIAGRIVGVISNRAGAGGLARAEAAGVPTQVIAHTAYADRSAYDAALAETIEGWHADYVLLAGFMRILTPAFVRRFHGRLLNIHPSLLPKYTGLHTHRRVLEAGDGQHGATVHFVTEELDGGPAIIQGQFIVRPDDTPETLAERVMQQIEVKIYPQAVAWLARAELRLEGGRVCLHGVARSAPVDLQALEEGFR